MRKFKILVIAHSLKQNKITNYGEEVSESQLTSPAESLISAGFIEEVFEEEDLDENALKLADQEDAEKLDEQGSKEDEIEVVEPEVLKPTKKIDIKDIKKSVKK